MRKIKKGHVALLLSLCLAGGSLAGCGGNAESTETKQEEQQNQSEGTNGGEAEKEVEKITFPLEEPVEMSMFAIYTGDVDLKDNVLFQKIQEETNVKWNLESCLGAEIKEKRGLSFGSNDYADVYYKSALSSEEIEKYGKQGILIPLNDLIENYAPNLKKALDARNAWDEITSADGNIYALPQITEGDLPLNNAYFINMQWLENLGLEEPKSIDDLYTVLKAFKDEDANGNGDANDEIPMTLTDVVKADLLLPYFGVNYSASSRLAFTDNGIQFAPKMDEFKEMLAFYEKLYAEGILDKNAFTQKHAQQGAIGMSGDILGTYFDAGPILVVGPDRSLDYQILTPFEEGTFPTKSGIDVGAFAITDHCEYPEIAMAWVDQFYSMEGGDRVWIGDEGVAHESDENGNWDWIGEASVIRQEATLQGSAIVPCYLDENSLWNTGKQDVVESALEEERRRVGHMGAEPFILPALEEQDSKVVATVSADVNAYVDEYMAQVITGEKDLDGTWEEFKATLDAMGVADMERVYNEAAAR